MPYLSLDFMSEKSQSTMENLALLLPHQDSRQRLFAMLIIGAHRINHGGFDGNICQQINDSCPLQGSRAYRYGAYAYYAARILGEFRSDPFAIFQPLIIRTALDITHIRVPALSSGNYRLGDTFFFVVRGAAIRSIPVAILGFVNCQGFPPYEGRLYYT
jgi:hypothetical protein